MGPVDPFGLVGRTLGEKYRVERLLGEGGFGVVYAGWHLMLSRPVAIKCLKPITGTGRDEEAATQMFLREAHVLFALTHPAIVRLYDAGAVVAGGRSVPYFVLEMIEGITLAEEISRRAKLGTPFTGYELRSIFEPVLDALAFAHERGVAHRDLKPANIMLGRGPSGAPVAKVLDFGLARMGVGAPSGITPAFTPRYAAPEQWDTTLGSTGPHTDVFALGLTLAEACTLSPAIAGDSATQLMRQVLDPSRRLSIARQRPDLPAGLDAMLARSSMMRPADRFPNAREMVAAFHAAFDPVRTSAYVLAGTVPPASSRKGTWAWLGLGVALSIFGVLVAAAGAMWLRGTGGSAHAPARAEVPSCAADAATGATVLARSIVSSGPMMSMQADKVAAIHQEDLRNCYVEAAVNEPSLRGELGLVVQAQPSGLPSYANAIDYCAKKEDCVRNVELRSCIERKAMEWRWPTAGDLSIVTYALRFCP
jgi:serine/threonine-protein kinase